MSTLVSLLFLLPGRARDRSVSLSPPRSKARKARETVLADQACSLDQARRLRFCASSCVLPNLDSKILIESGILCVHASTYIYTLLRFPLLSFDDRAIIIFASPFLFQLYEIDDNPKRKEFLDELFTFMQGRGELRTNQITRKSLTNVRRTHVRRNAPEYSESRI